MKKLLSIVLAVIMIATTIPFAFAADDGMLLYVDITNALGTDKSAEGVWLYAFSIENDFIVNSEEMTHVSENIYSYEIPSNTYIAAVGVPFTDGTRVEWNFVIDWTGNNLYIPTGDRVGTWEIYSDCSHESYTDGKCDACGAECRHKNITDGICDDCGAEGRFITITMTDSYGDGWNGNAIVIEKLIDGTYTEVSTATIENGNNGTFTAILPEDGVYALRWVSGGYPEECSFTVTVNSEPVFEVMNGSSLVDGQVVYIICEHDWSNNDITCAKGCGYECHHQWGEGVLTRPHQNDDNTWSDGYYTYTCKNGCGATTTETVKRADYTAFDEAEAELEYWFQLPFIIPSVIEEYKAKANNLILESGLEDPHTAIETEQNLIDELADGFYILAEEMEIGYANGTFLKVNLKPFKDAEAIEEELAAKYGVEAVLSITISDRIFERFDEIYNEYYVIRDNENATALEYNDDIRRLAEGLTAIYAELEFCIQGVHNVETWSDNGENHIGDCISCTATGITAEHTDADGDKLCDSGCGHNFEKPEESFKPSLNAQTNADGSQIRFITCVDSLNYKEVGFVITNANNKEQTTTKISKTVYNSIVAGGKKLTAADITGDENMKYILTYTVKNLPEDAAFEVTSFVVNLDGTKIYGETETYTVADMLG